MRIDPFKAKVKLLLILNRVVNRCRMYESPAGPENLCHVCAGRGGYFLCWRSMKLAKRGKPVA